jgi:hypothetical protein
MFMKCSNCNGSGTVKEYDDYDRYYLHTCSMCEGSGEKIEQKMTVKELIDKLKVLNPDSIVKIAFDCEGQVGWDDIGSVGYPDKQTIKYFDFDAVLIKGVDF